MAEQVETVIVGGGQAGLAMSYWLTQLGREHVVLERARLAERWRSERWDSLCFNLPNWAMQLPGGPYRGDDPDGFAPRDEVVRFLEDYAARTQAPVRLGTRVTSLSQKPGSQRLLVQTDGGTLEAANVVVATGPFQAPAIPPLGAALPPGIVQVHSSCYRNPARLPPGAVLVVGSGASGGEIAEELYTAGRRVYLSVGRYRRAPRRYRGRDYAAWALALGGFDRTVDTVPSPDAMHPPSPLLTGADGGHDLDLRRFAADGVVLLGRLRAVRDGTVALAPDLEASLAAGDEWCAAFRRSVDDLVREVGLAAPEEAPEDTEPPGQAPSHPILELDLEAAGITSVVWASGYRYDFDWIEIPVFDEVGAPIHRFGVTRCPGVYFLGLKWLRKVKSSYMLGVGEDAAYLADHIATRTSRTSPRSVRGAGSEMTFVSIR